MFYLLKKGKIVADSSGVPYEFNRKRQAKDFAKGQGLFEVEIVDDISEHPRRCRHQLKRRIKT